MIKKYLPFLFLLPFQVYCNNLHFAPISSGGYFVTGEVDPNLMTLNPGVTWGRFYVNVHETKRDYYAFINKYSQYCSVDRNEAAAYMNRILKDGVSATTKMTFDDQNGNWTVSVFCQASATEYWYAETTLPSPPSSARCDIDYPSTVSFGSVVLGERKSINANIKITCSKYAYMKVSLSKNIIDLNDAKVKYAFPNGSNSFQGGINGSTPASFDVTFTLDNTGTAVGYKSGSAVMLFQWE
ncbi:hypothetical protein WN53_03160 [Serratia fonticola]|jgi:hypothetical protein|uniref:hypothetical protein n=1 Tax=Serratia fonticola TaxID=47917 RepID=UPI0004677FAA|nr:hypothetical protein [Serratia fonticola]AKG68217.1 hypothetical protein WN53_03160 [Serratia fonticola]